MMPHSETQEPPRAKTVAEVHPAARARRLVTIRFDDGSTLTVPRRDAKQAGAGPGMTLLPAAIDSLRQAEVSAAERFASRRLNTAERTAQELREYLGSHGFSKPAVEPAVQRCIELGLVDDTRAAAQHVHSRASRKPRSRHMLRAELLRRGISESAADSAIDDVDEEAGARELVARQAHRAPQDSYEAFRDWLGRHLMRRGYPYSLSQRVMREAWEQLPATSGHNHA